MMARVRENERSLTTAGILASPEDFTLVLGGPSTSSGAACTYLALG
jgi:hypothetical protein